MQRLTTLTIHDLTEKEILILRQEVENRKKSTASTWLLWFFLGEFGAHRFYLGRVGTGVAMLLTLGGLFVWWFVDIFLISGMLQDNEKKVQDEVLNEILALRQRQGISQQQWMPQQQSTPQQWAPQQGMPQQWITCTRCGSRNAFGSRYCDACGAALVSPGQR